MQNLQLIKHIIINNQLDLLPKEAFNDLEYGIIREAKSQVKQFNVKPTIKSIATELLKDKSPEIRQQFKGYIEQLVNASELDETQLTIELFRAKTRAQINLRKKIIVAQEADELADVSELEAKIIALSKSNLDELQKPVNAKNWHLLERAEMDELEIGIDWLKDNNVPFKKKVLYAFIATTNGGKTIIKTWLATQFIKAGHNVLYLAQEEPYSDTIRRVYQSVLGLTEQEYHEKTRDSFETLGEQFIHFSDEKLYGNIFVVEWPNIKVSVLKQKIKDFKETHGIKLDAIFIDYGKLVDIDYVGSSKQEWERIGLIFKELKAMCMELNVCAVTSIQLNREASAKLLQRGETPDLTSVAGAFEATHHANYIWSVKLNHAAERQQVKTRDTVEGTFVLHVQKQKYGDLRPGDNMSFVWTSDHNLTQTKQQVNEAPEPTIPWAGKYDQVTDELPDNLDEIL